MKTDIFCYKSDMHVRSMRFSILCTLTDRSDRTKLCSVISLAFKTPL